MIDLMLPQEILVSAGDMGRDYEHCLELQRRLDDLEDVSIQCIDYKIYSNITDLIERYIL